MHLFITSLCCPNVIEADINLAFMLDLSGMIGAGVDRQPEEDDEVF